jgi:hypothetical protein
MESEFVPRHRLSRSLFALLCLMLLSSALRAEPQRPEWLFAPSYTQDQLLHSPPAVREFLRDFAVHEAPFFAAARDPESGLTFDGWDLDPRSGLPLKARRFSAASKECLDLALLVKALQHDPLISLVVAPDRPQDAPERAAEILARKIASYEAYRLHYPGFAGYMAWFSSGSRAEPMKGWESAFPTLDLGEMIWALKLAERTLRLSGRVELAERYRSFNEGLRQTAKRAMFRPPDGVRGRVEVADPRSSSSAYSGDRLTTGEHGVHEGQMIVLYMSLYGGLTPEESNRVWQGIRMTRIEHPAGTTWQGFWGSPHEEWAYLFLPYRDLPGYRQLFRIREKIRTQNAREHGYPGFGASCHHPLGQGYVADSGIEGIGSQPVLHQDIYTPYGAFPILLEFAGREEGNVGLAWLHNMLLGPRLQGPFGAGESGDNQGTGAAPIKTIDASFTTLLALSGGLEKEAAAMLKEEGKYDQFLAILKGEYEEAFAGAPLREPVDFALPKAPAPPGCPPYPSPQ